MSLIPISHYYNSPWWLSYVFDNVVYTVSLPAKPCCQCFIVLFFGLVEKCCAVTFANIRISSYYTYIGHCYIINVMSKHRPNNIYYHTRLCRHSVCTAKDSLTLGWWKISKASSETQLPNVLFIQLITIWPLRDSEGMFWLELHNVL